MLFKGFPDAASHFAGNLYQLIRAKLKNDDCLKPFILGLLWLERNCSHNAWESLWRPWRTTDWHLGSEGDFFPCIKTHCLFIVSNMDVRI